MADVQLSGVVVAGGQETAAAAGGNSAPVTPAAGAAPLAATGSPTAPGELAANVAAGAGQTGAPRPPGSAPKGSLLTDLQVKDAVKNANAALAAIGTQLVFVFDDQAHHLAVKLLDIQTQKVVQQIPSAAMHATASALSGSSSSGALVDTKA
jgi:hypothetical protein